LVGVIDRWAVVTEVAKAIAVRVVEVRDCWTAVTNITDVVTI
jgi:hypothetical protein